MKVGKRYAVILYIDVDDGVTSNDLMAKYMDKTPWEVAVYDVADEEVLSNVRLTPTGSTEVFVP
jgi:hypothetical protein